MATFVLTDADQINKLFMLHDALFTLLHEPLRRARSAADAHRAHVFREPRHIYLVGTFYLIAARIDATTLVEEHLSVATFTT